MGYDYPTELKGIYGNPCVRIWDDLMNTLEAIYRGSPEKKEFDTPEDVVEREFCPLSGELATPYCQDPVYGQATETGWFVRGREPRDFCTVHREPPVHIIPDDPSDPLRVPLLPGDLVTEEQCQPPNVLQALPKSRKWYTDFFERIPRPFKGLWS